MASSKQNPTVEELLAHAGWMRSLARGIVGDPELAEDVVQDAWVAALDRPPAPRSPAGLRAWLARVVANLARTRRRREGARGSVERQAARTEAVAGELDAVARLELQRELADALLELDEPYRSAVIWRHLDGLGAEEIARRGGCSPEAARQRVARGLALLRRRIEARSGPDERQRGLLALAAVARAPEGPLSASLAGALVMSKTAWTLASIAGLVLSWTAWSVLREPAGPAHPGVLADELLEDPAPIPEPPAELAVQAPAPSAARSAVALPASERARTSLIVRDRDGQPIEGVALAADGAERAWGTTGADGRFELDDTLFELSALPIRAVATHDDFLTAELELSVGEESELVVARKPMVEIELVEPGGGRPAGPWSAKVWVREAASGAIVDFWAEFDGTLAAVRLPVGRLERAEGRARGFAPGSAAFDVPLEPDTTARIRLEVEAGIQLEGRVIDAATREPIPNATVWTEEVFLNEDSAVDRDTTDADGRFELHGVTKNHVSVSEEDPGRFWWVSVGTRAEGYQERPWELKALPVAEDGRCTTEIELTRASASLFCDVVGTEEPQALSVWAVQSDGNLVSTFATGDFELTGLAAGDVELFAANSHTRDEPFVCGYARADLRAGTRTQVEVALEHGTGTLSGRVLDAGGGPIEGAGVSANLIARMGWIAFGAFDWTTQSGADGQFSFAGLPSGHYDVELSALPAGLCALEGHWELELTVGGSASGGELVVSECRSVDGWVELGALDPAGLRVRARGPEDRDLDVESPVAADATFRLTGLPSVETEIVLLQGDLELCRVPIGGRGARDVVLRPER